MTFSNMLWIYNVFAGYSGLQMLDDVFYALFNVLFTVEAVAMTMLCEQDVSFKHAA
jgi:hypothetical protein